jgi:hypothetical protein
MRPLLIFLAIIGISLTACIKFGDGTTTTTVKEERISFNSPEEQAAFERGLSEAGIPFKVEIKEGVRYATWSGEHSSAANRVRTTVLGVPLPPGRHISFSPSEHQEKFKSWLSENAISYTTKVSHGREYVIWDEADSIKVKSWKHFGPAAQQEAPNPSIERTSPGKPGAASHVKR